MFRVAIEIRKSCQGSQGSIKKGYKLRSIDSLPWQFAACRSEILRYKWYNKIWIQVTMLRRQIQYYCWYILKVYFLDTLNKPLSRVKSICLQLVGVSQNSMGSAWKNAQPALIKYATKSAFILLHSEGKQENTNPTRKIIKNKSKTNRKEKQVKRHTDGESGKRKRQMERPAAGSGCWGIDRQQAKTQLGKQT